MSYQREREEFIAIVTREGLPIDVVRLLLREATGLNRRAELACSSEAADRDRVRCPQAGKLPTSKEANEKYPCLCEYNGSHHDVPRIAVQDWHAERRVQRALQHVNDRLLQSGAPINVQAPALWNWQTEGDPRGYVLRIIPPSYAARNQGKDRFNLDAIGVPNGPSGLRF